ncbi:MAG: bifunctional phosphopantothenoylcysteine decarboxylase/phosphopantothenate--cysteine ligase CoaBC [bacterium]
MKVLLGVTSSIAAYKAAEIASQLVKSGCDVFVVMTKHATKLIGEATFRALTGNPVRVDLFEPEGRVLHIDIATSLDVLAIAPATANIIGKIANGICDDLLTTIVLSTKAPVVIAPAMNEAMYLNRAVQENLMRLRYRGYQIIEPETGWLACGKEGKGRLADPSLIVKSIIAIAGRSKHLAGKKVVVTGGPTIEPIDAIRFISNRSSGKMAVALAEEAFSMGAETTLIMGPTHLPMPSGVNVVMIETTSEMEEAIKQEWDDTDCLVMAAAVCDFRVASVHDGKIPRSAELDLHLVETHDIVSNIAREKGKRIVVGFALEVENEVEAGLKKLKAKNLDIVMVNNPLKQGAQFGGETNFGYLIDSNGKVEEVPLLSKREVARKIFEKVKERFERS